MSELIFVLNNAKWPVLLLDSDGNVYHRNPAAEAIFGPQPSGDTTCFSNMWATNNGVALKDFLAGSTRATRETQNLKLKTKTGESAFAASLCTFKHDNREFELLQLLPPLTAEPKTVVTPPPAAPPKTAPPATVTATATADSNIAFKQKLDCALQLARTVALDFNNALTSILGHTSLLLGRMESNHPWRDSLVEVEKSAARAAEIANDLAMFSRQEKESRTQAAGNLNQLVSRAIETIKNVSPDKLAWNIQPTRKLYTVKFDEAKMQQAVLKVLENAIQSLEGKAGNITLATRNLDLSAVTQDCNTQLSPGSYVCVEITDTGCGISAGALPRVFEPFFTTKKAPHRGLGLAWVYGVVTNHGGSVAISSRPDVGTSVRVYLPADKTFIEENNLSNDDLKGTQTILMVDDEDLLLTMGKAILSSFGYKVITANNGKRALELLADPENPVDLLVTDLVMPGISGRELVAKAAQVSPHTRVLCTSGYAFPAKEEDKASFLPKPFTSRDLLLKVKLSLNSSDITAKALVD